LRIQQHNFRRLAAIGQMISNAGAQGDDKSVAAIPGHILDVPDVAKEMMLRPRR
jgi:hypothetical protein